MTKQIHPYVREYQQFYKSVNRKCKYKNPRRRRSWWKAWWKRYNAEHFKENENENNV